jgi:hypothetical protein
LCAFEKREDHGVAARLGKYRGDGLQSRRRSEMSDEQRKEETEVEGHGYPPKYGADDETAKDDEVEGHKYPPKYGADDETPKDEVEGHVHRRGAQDEQGEDDEVEGHVHRRS